MAGIYVPRSSVSNGFRVHPVDAARCRVEVYEPVSRNFSQCARKKVVEVDGIGYCKQHSPDATRAREQQRRDREANEQCQRDRRFKRPAEYRDALRAIAEGHNDPRALAAETLAKWGDLDPR